MNSTKARPKTKWCTGCRQEVAVYDFYKRAASPDGLAHHCKECRKAYNRRWGRMNRQARKRSQMNYKRQKQYGLSPEQYEEMIAVQAGVCKICGGKDTDRALAVDHCHATGRIRGLLCHACNTGLGHFSDDSGRLQAAIEYLELN